MYKFNLDDLSYHVRQAKTAVNNYAAKIL